MTNKLKYGTLTLNKLDENNKPLSGSQWQLYDLNDNLIKIKKIGSGSYAVDNSSVVSSMYTDTKGVLKINNLKEGSYYIIETKAPVNHMLYGEKIRFDISYESETTLNIVRTVKDYKSFLSQTGGIGITVFYVVGGIIGVVAVLFICNYFVKNRKRKENHNEK